MKITRKHRVSLSAHRAQSTLTGPGAGTGMQVDLRFAWAILVSVLVIVPMKYWKGDKQERSGGRGVTFGPDPPKASLVQLPAGVGRGPAQGGAVSH